MHRVYFAARHARETINRTNTEGDVDLQMRFDANKALVCEVDSFLQERDRTAIRRWIDTLNFPPDYSRRVCDELKRRCEVMRRMSVVFASAHYARLYDPVPGDEAPAEWCERFDADVCGIEDELGPRLISRWKSFARLSGRSYRRSRENVMRATVVLWPDHGLDCDDIVKACCEPVPSIRTTWKDALVGFLANLGRP